MEVLEFQHLRLYEFFPNVFARVLLNGERMTFFLVEIPPHSTIPVHSHDHEQMGVCLKGRAEFSGDDRTIMVSEGMVYRFAPYEKHSVRNQTEQPSIFLDVFSPQRVEYLEKQQRFEKGDLP